MKTSRDFDTLFAACPMIAILRGVQPNEVEAIGEMLVDAGFTLIEVPLNSPDPFESIRRLADHVGDRAMVGAGTVLNAEDVARVRDAGGCMIISPNVDASVIRSTVTSGMASLPGYFTPTEAFTAIEAGATALKLFPAEAASPAVLKAHRAVLPKTFPLLIVGGVSPEGMSPWREAGANGFGLGSALYRIGSTATDVSHAAKAFVEADRGLRK